MKKAWGLMFLTLLFWIPSAQATPEPSGVTPEARSAQIAQFLKGIPDDQWATIAGKKSEDRYEVLSGDTLYDVSARLFGDSKYWPKIWEINNQTILNPHMIRPGMFLVFYSGGAGSLPSIEASNHAPSPPPRRVLNNGYSSLIDSKGRVIHRTDDGPGPTWDEDTPQPNSEWQNLPKQSWEPVEAKLPSYTDKDGLDRRSVVQVNKNRGFEFNSLVSCQRVKPIAEVKGSLSESNHLNLKDQVMISTYDSETTLEEGQTYSLLGTSTSIKRENGKTGWIYELPAKVKILGVHDGQYLGEVTSLKGLAERGAGLVPTPAKVQPGQMVPGPNNLVGNILLDSSSSLFVTSPYNWVYINRGTGDGVEPGMIFRVFQYKDPQQGKALTSSNIFVQGDAQVYQSCENFSIAQIIWSRGTIDAKSEVILLTDPNDRLVRYYLNGNHTLKSPPPQRKKEALEEDDDIDISEDPTLPEQTDLENQEDDFDLDQGSDTDSNADDEIPNPDDSDWLDQLDNNQDLNDEEAKELKQLEDYEGVPGEGGSEESSEEAPVETAPLDHSDDLSTEFDSGESSELAPVENPQFSTEIPFEDSSPHLSTENNLEEGDLLESEQTDGNTSDPSSDDSLEEF